MPTIIYLSEVEVALNFAVRTTRLTPNAVSKVPTTVEMVISSLNKTHAITAVVGGTR